MSEKIQSTTIHLLCLASVAACALLISRLSFAGVKRVEYSKVEAVLDLYQGESKCVDILEARYGVDAIIVDGKNEYTILNLCDFE